MIARLMAFVQALLWKLYVASDTRIDIGNQAAIHWAQECEYQADCARDDWGDDYWLDVEPIEEDDTLFGEHSLHNPLSTPAF